MKESRGELVWNDGFRTSLYGCSEQSSASFVVSEGGNGHTIEFLGDHPPAGDKLPTLNLLSLAKLAFLSPVGLIASDTVLPLRLVPALLRFALSPESRFGTVEKAVVRPFLRSSALLIFSIEIASVSESEDELSPISVREKMSSAFMRSNSSSESVLDAEVGSMELTKTGRTISGAFVVSIGEERGDGIRVESVGEKFESGSALRSTAVVRSVLRDSVERGDIFGVVRPSPSGKVALSGVRASDASRGRPLLDDGDACSVAISSTVVARDEGTERESLSVFVTLCCGRNAPVEPEDVRCSPRRPMILFSEVTDVGDGREGRDCFGGVAGSKIGTSSLSGVSGRSFCSDTEESVGGGNAGRNGTG